MSKLNEDLLKISFYFLYYFFNEHMWLLILLFCLQDFVDWIRYLNDNWHDSPFLLRSQRFVDGDTDSLNDKVIVCFSSMTDAQNSFNGHYKYDLGIVWVKDNRNIQQKYNPFRFEWYCFQNKNVIIKTWNIQSDISLIMIIKFKQTIVLFSRLITHRVIVWISVLPNGNDIALRENDEIVRVDAESSITEYNGPIKSEIQYHCNFKRTNRNLRRLTLVKWELCIILLLRPTCDSS